MGYIKQSICECRGFTPPYPEGSPKQFSDIGEYIHEAGCFF